ncbi:hypothetical protein HPB47_001288 [Ixodes persulcatus]|uniref:Uncharacterized protein n=1 Tax=Ixodes persulcatus TaxID=34615 RepID=A0AC60PPG1_IXOPE|nr:hypothetical protein HPB47_001288 [Ixodes persulcatus]
MAHLKLSERHHFVQINDSFKSIANVNCTVGPTREQEQQQQPPSVASLALKLPPFWPADRPALWFALVDAEFSTWRIMAQVTTFYHVIAALSPTEAAEVGGLILNSPVDNPFDFDVRTETSPTTPDGRRSLRQETFPDASPPESAALRKSDQRSRLHSAPALLQRLPANVCMVLTAVGDIPLFDLAALADKVLEAVSSTISSIQALPQAQQATVSTISASPSIVELCTLQSKIRNLTKSVAALQTESGRSPQRCSGYRSQSRSWLSSTNICGYQYTFEDQAKRFRPLAQREWETGCPITEVGERCEPHRGRLFFVSEKPSCLQLLVGTEAERLLDATTYISVSGIPSRTSSLCLAQIPEKGTCRFSNILKEVPYLTRISKHHDLPCTQDHGAFHHGTELFVERTKLAHPRENVWLTLVTDASVTAVGVVLQDFADGYPQPLSFFSRKLSPTEQRYS